MSELTFEQKKKLAERISSTYDKILLKQIREIILCNNPDTVMKKINNGYLSYFQNYTNDTYIKIIECFEEHSKPEKQKDISSNELSNANIVKYSTKDKRILRRQRYEDTINQQNTESQS
jgi:hypothetical protein